MDLSTVVLALWKMLELLKDGVISMFGLMFFIGLVVGFALHGWAGSLWKGLMYLFLIIVFIIVLGALALVVFYPGMLSGVSLPVLPGLENVSQNASNWTSVG